MAQSILITLTTAGTDTGPFNLYSNVDGYSVAFESGIAKGPLLAGYLSELVPDAATSIRVKSANPICSSYVDLDITGTTTTTTSTTTATPTTTTTTTDTPLPISIEVVNDVTSGASISIFEINSGAVPYTIVFGSFPIYPGESVVVTIPVGGTYDLLLSGFKGTTQVVNIDILDSSIAHTCYDFDEEDGNTFTHEFISIPCSENGIPFSHDVVITLDDGTC